MFYWYRRWRICSIYLGWVENTLIVKIFNLFQRGVIIEYPSLNIILNNKQTRT